MSPQDTQAKSRRQNAVTGSTAIITFVSLVVASAFDFREDVELLVALQGALTALVHRRF